MAPLLLGVVSAALLASAASQAVAMPGAQVSAVEVFYFVDRRELFCLVTMILLMWEAVKWFALEASKTMAVDWVLRKIAGWFRRPGAQPAAEPAAPARWSPPY